MNDHLNCEWMRLKLKSPLVVASLTPISNTRIKEHTDFFVRAVAHGAGAIVLPSINPQHHGSEDRNEEKVETYIINTGIRKNDPMAFSVLGPTKPNIVSVEYGLNLAKTTKKLLNGTPIIASIAAIGGIHEILEVVDGIDRNGLDGIELNVSCPNVETKEGDFRDSILHLVNEVRKKTDKSISLKLNPYQDYTYILERVGSEIDGLTLSNAYIGLIPPTLDSDDFSPFRKAKQWAPGGVYGPFERPLTFYKLYQFSDMARKFNLDIACVGGIVSSDDAIQAILLGADVVEISSGIQWGGTAVFKHINDDMKGYLKSNSIKNISDIKGISLSEIKKDADEISSLIQSAKSWVNPEKCHGCVDCICIDRLCFAISKDNDKKAHINQELCSGCGWCVNTCLHNAISLNLL